LSPTLKKVLKSLLFLGIGVGLVYLSVKDITSKDIDSIRNNPPRWWWLIASMLVGLLSHWIRAIRWRMLIEPVAEKPGQRNTFFAVMIGYMANYAPILRFGEVYRCGILSRYEKAPFTTLIGTVIVERTIDVLMLGIFFILMLLLRAEKVYNVVMPKITTYLNTKLNLLSSHILIVIIALVIITGGLIFILRKRSGIFGFAQKYIQGFWQGIKSVGKLKKPLLFWFYSVAIWMLYLLSTYLCFFCFNETSSLTLADAIVVLIFGTMGIMVAPGGVGAFQILIKNVLEKIYRIPGTVPFAMAWLIWGSQFVLIVTLGLISLVLLPILNKNDNKV
jgi:glycosyltransferase 2 family protein